MAGVFSSRASPRTTPSCEKRCPVDNSIQQSTSTRPSAPDRRAVGGVQGGDGGGSDHVVAVGTAPQASSISATSTTTTTPSRSSDPVGTILVSNRAPVAEPDRRRSQRRGFGWAARRYNQKLFGDHTRIGRCGRFPITSAVALKRGTDGSVHASGLMQCGLVHACPPCAAKIRARRAEEVGHKATAHLEAGGGLCFLTVTLPHDIADDLSDLWDAVAGAWSTVIGGTPFHGSKHRAGAKQRFGITGFIRAFDLTHSPTSGWHPHLHVLVFLDQPLTELDDKFWELRAWFRNRWAGRIEALTGRAVSATFGVDMVSVKNNTGIGTYVSKVNLELARGDLKAGRVLPSAGGGRVSRTPFQILADVIDSQSDPDCVDDERLWVEYVTASKGRQLITTTNALKHMYPTDNATDEEIASTEQDGQIELLIDHHVWRRLADRDDNLIHQAICAHERYGPTAAYRVIAAQLSGLRLDDAGTVPLITNQSNKQRKKSS